MTRRISDQKRKEITDLYFRQRLTVRDISTKAGVGSGTVSKILNEETEQMLGNGSGTSTPKSGQDIQELAKGLRLVYRYGEKTELILRCAERVEKLESGTGKPIEELLPELEELEKRVIQEKSTLKRLTEAKEVAKRSIRSLEELKKIQGSLDETNIDIAKLTHFIEFHKDLERMGFQPKVATYLAKALSELGLNPAEAVSELKQIVGRCRNLGDAIMVLRQTKENLVVERNVLTEQNERIHREMRGNEESIKKMREEYKMCEERVSKLRIEEAELEGIINKTESIASELNEKLEEVNVLLKSKAPLAVLAALMSDPAKAGEPLVVLTVLFWLNSRVDTYTEINSSALRYPGAMRQKIKELSKVLANEIQKPA